MNRMRSLSNDFTKYMMYFVMTFLAVGISSCSSDDDADDLMAPTGSIVVEDNQTITDNMIVVDNITVSQDAWVVAVMGGDESTNDFITEPVWVDAGSNSDVELTFNEDVDFTGGDAGNEISIKLYADNPNEGTPGEWDSSDDPIMDGTTMVTETITVFVDEASFTDFDSNADGFLDAEELSNAYMNDFTTWDADADGGLNEEEFSNTTFGNTDADDDDLISEDEWNQGFASMYGNYTEETDFATYDANADGSLSSEEWMTGFGETEWFTTYDADADTSVSEAEWDTGLFGDWDMDGDDRINEDEYNNFSIYSNNW